MGESLRIEYLGSEPECSPHLTNCLALTIRGVPSLMSGSPPPGRTLTSAGAGPLAPDRKQRGDEPRKDLPPGVLRTGLCPGSSLSQPPKPGLVGSPTMQRLQTLREMKLASLCKCMQIRSQVGLPPTAGVCVICPGCSATVFSLPLNMAAVHRHLLSAHRKTD